MPRYGYRACQSGPAPLDHTTEYRPAICRGDAIGNTNLWRFFMPCRGRLKLYEYGWEIPCFFACERRKRSRPYPFPHGRTGGNTGAQNHRNEHFSKPKEGGIQYGGSMIFLCRAERRFCIGKMSNFYPLASKMRAPSPDVCPVAALLFFLC